MAIWQEQSPSASIPPKQALLSNIGWGNDFPKHTCRPQNLYTFLKIKGKIRGKLEPDLIIRPRKGTRHGLPHASSISEIFLWYKEKGLPLDALNHGFWRQHCLQSSWHLVWRRHDTRQWFNGYTVNHYVRRCRTQLRLVMDRSLFGGNRIKELG